LDPKDRQSAFDPACLHQNHDEKCGGCSREEEPEAAAENGGREGGLESGMVAGSNLFEGFVAEDKTGYDEKDVNHRAAAVDDP
jgi:hypothetical protein